METLVLKLVREVSTTTSGPSMRAVRERDIKLSTMISNAFIVVLPLLIENAAHAILSKVIPVGVIVTVGVVRRAVCIVMSILGKDLNLGQACCINASFVVK